MFHEYNDAVEHANSLPLVAIFCFWMVLDVEVKSKWRKPASLDVGDVGEINGFLQSSQIKIRAGESNLNRVAGRRWHDVMWQLW